MDFTYPDLMRGCRETENVIPRVERAFKDPTYLHEALSNIPPSYRSHEDASKVEQAVREAAVYHSAVLQSISFLRWKQAFVSQFPRLVRRQPILLRLVHDEDRRLSP